MLLERFLSLLAEGRIVESGARGADDSEVARQQPVGIETVERRQKHAPREVAGRAEQDQCRDPLCHAAAILLSERAQRAKMSRRTRIHKRVQASAIIAPRATTLRVIAIAAEIPFPRA